MKIIRSMQGNTVRCLLTSLTFLFYQEYLQKGDGDKDGFIALDEYKSKTAHTHVWNKY